MTSLNLAKLMLSDSTNQQIKSTNLDGITQFFMNLDNTDIDITKNSQLILNRLSSTFYTSVNNRIVKVTDSQSDLLHSRRSRRRLSATHAQVNSLLGKRSSEGGSSSTTPSCSKPLRRHSALNGPGLRKQFRTKELKAEGSVKFLNSLGNIWGTNSHNEFCQFHATKKTALFKLKGRYTKNPLRFKSSKNKICLLSGNSKIEILDSRSKKRLVRTPLSNHRSRVSVSELHLDEKSKSCYANYDNFYSVKKLSILKRQIETFDLRKGQKGGKLYCRTAFLPLKEDKMIFAHNISGFLSEKLKVKLEIVSLNSSKPEFSKNSVEFEAAGDHTGDVGKLISIDPVAQKFVHVIGDRIKYYQLKQSGELKLLAEHKEANL
jgi:hypothetical protein